MVDSFPDYIQRIETASGKLQFEKGEVLAARLKGMHKEYQREYEKAIAFYQQCLEISREKGWIAYEECALSDLGFLYTDIKNKEKAKEYYRQAAELSLKGGIPATIINSFTNLAAICNQLNQPDTALYYLDRAWQLAERSPESSDFVSLRNNTGNAWFAKKQWDRSMSYFRQNYHQSRLEGNRDQLWYDVLNMADVEIERRQFDSAKNWLDTAHSLALGLSSQRKEADVYHLYAKLYERTGEFRKALTAIRRWSSLDSGLVNTEMRETILEMETRFNSRKKEQENRLLQTQVEAGKLRSRNLLIALLSLILLAGAIGFFWFQNRKKNEKLRVSNELIQAQNEKLSSLNMEKNSLISMVSHDLHTPFTAIHMWSNVLASADREWTEEEKRAIERIRSAAQSGDQLINRVLDVEGDEVNRQSIQLEKIPLREFLGEYAENFRNRAMDKNIGLSMEFPAPDLTLLADRHLLERAVANLLSNAIKYTHTGGMVTIRLASTPEGTEIQIQDNGPGISEEDLKQIFTRYSTTSNKPSGHEKAHGLGLFIVKRIMQELQGEVRCKSTPGQGSCFTLFFAGTGAT
jgi:signal transduction histidine kinase